MLIDAHRQAAEDLESSIAALQGNPQAARAIIECAWGAAFHWIAYGCQQKHNQHRENHLHLGQYLRGLGETTTADNWTNFESTRQGSFYGTKTSPLDMQKALTLLADIRTWATT